MFCLVCRGCCRVMGPKGEALGKIVRIDSPDTRDIIQIFRDFKGTAATFENEQEALWASRNFGWVKIETEDEKLDHLCPKCYAQQRRAA